MACLNSYRKNCYGPSTPCPVVCCSCTNCCENLVQNPPTSTTNIAFFTLSTPTIVVIDSIVPVTLVFNAGTAIASPSVGNVVLATGTYEVSYNVTSVLGEDGTNSFGILLGGVVVPASIGSASGEAGDIVSISNSVILSVDSSTALTLNNLGDDTVTINVANLTIRKIN